MATPTNPNLFIDETLPSGATANTVSVQTNTNNTKTLVANYNDPTVFATPLLQIRNDVGGSKGQVQFHNGTTFGGSSNLTFDANVANVSKLSLRGDMYINGNLTANINTNLNNFRITGGLGNQILATDGTGNLSWVSYDPNIAGGIFNGDSNVIVYPNSDIRFSSNNVPNVVIVDSSGITTTNLVVDGNTNLGANSNVTLNGGLPGQFLKTDGAGNLSWDQPAGIYMSETPPFVGPGNVWFNTDEGRSYVSYDGTWVDMSPAIMPNPDMYANTITFPDGSVFTTANGGGGSSDRLVNGNKQVVLGSDGNLTLPTNTSSINYANGQPYSGANTGNIGFTGNAIYSLGGVIVENADLTHVATSALILPINGNSAAPVQITNTYGNIALTTGINSGSLKTWTFGTDGNTTFPDGTTLGVVTGSGFALNTNKDITILKDAVTGFEVRDGNVKIYSNNISWTFDRYTGITFPDATVQTTAFVGKAGTVTTAAQPNITSVGTLSSLSLSGNVKTDGNVLATGNISTAANVTGNYILGNGVSLTGIVATVAQTVSASAQSNITSVGSLTNLIVLGNIQAQGTTDSGGPTSGALKTSGGLGVAKSASIGNNLFVGPGAALTAFTNPTIIVKDTGGDYIQAALVNASDTGSSDWVAYGDNGTDGGGWVDLGFTSSAYNDANFTVTGPNDGYVFAQAQSASGLGGNLVLATGDQGTTNDIIFATGGFQTENIFGKIIDATQTLDIPTGSANIGGNFKVGGTSNFAGNAKFSSNVLILDNLQVNGNINFTGNVTQISGQSGQFFGDANGIGALYAGISTGYAVVANPVIQAAADTNDYTQINFQNLNAGNTASTEYAATADNGNDTVNYIDMGIAGSSWDGTQTNSVGDAARADDGWVYVQGGTGGGNLILGATSTNKKVKILTGGPGNANIRAFFDDGGLSVLGNVRAGNLFGNGGNLSNIQAANVSGLGNVALLSKDGNASNVLYGNGVFAAASAGVSYGNSNVATYLASYGSNTLTTTGNVSVGNIIGNGQALTGIAGANVTGQVGFAAVANSVAVGNVSGLGNIATVNLTGSSSNVLYANGVFAPPGSASYSDSNVVTLLSAFGSNNVSTTGNITSANVLTSANVSAAGNIYSGLGATKGFVLGNVNSRIMAVGSNSYATFGQNIVLSPDQSASVNAGVQVLGGGYLLAPNGSRVIALGNDGSATVTTNLSLPNGGNINVSTGSVSVGGTITRSGSITSTAWGSSGIGLKIPTSVYTDNSTATGTQVVSVINAMQAPTLAYSNTVTVTTAATLSVAAPTAGTNATITNPYAIITSGAVSVSGNVTVNGTAGIIMPNRPAFRVTGTGGQISSSTIVTSSHWSVDFQQGSALDGTTGLFTAPVAGLYQVNLVVRAFSNTGVSSQAVIEKNSTTVVIMVEWAANTTMNHTGGSTVVKLAVGDTLALKVILGSISFDGTDNWSVAYIG